MQILLAFHVVAAGAPILLFMLQYNFPSRQGNGDALGSDMNRMKFPDLVIRPGTYLDSYLSSQPFSRCTVPVVRLLSQPANFPSIYMTV